MVEKKKNKKKLTKKQRQQMKKQLYKSIFCSIFLSLLVIAFGYLIFKTDILQPRVDEVTASYISFNNSNTTDMLKINSLKKMSDEKGSSSFNKSYVEFEVTGSKKSNYDIVVYSIINKIDYKYVKFCLISDNEVINSGNLEDLKLKSDGGKILYQGSLNKSVPMLLRMWVSNDYESKVGNTSFEIKVKIR